MVRRDLLPRACAATSCPVSSAAAHVETDAGPRLPCVPRRRRRLRASDLGPFRGTRIAPMLGPAVPRRLRHARAEHRRGFCGGRASPVMSLGLLRRRTRHERRHSPLAACALLRSQRAASSDARAQRPPGASRRPRSAHDATSASHAPRDAAGHRRRGRAAPDVVGRARRGRSVPTLSSALDRSPVTARPCAGARRSARLLDALDHLHRRAARRPCVRVPSRVDRVLPGRRPSTVETR